MPSPQRIVIRGSKIITAIVILFFTHIARITAQDTPHANSGPTPQANPPAPAADTSTLFGDSIPISNGLLGRIYLLPENTRNLPNLDTMQPLPTVIYTKSINVPERDWSAGFPGLHDRFEWFAIQYTGTFRVVHPGKYTFRLVSDDGSKLYLDDSLLIDDDGEHVSISRTGEVTLNDSLSIHSIKLRYFQGPRFRLALQLYWTVGDGKEEIFPGNGFILYTPHKSFPWWWLLLAAAVLLTGYLIWRKKRKKKQIL